ncbi:RidA family protein [Butyricicoccus intestinisimiae]|uniref:RidA family protein n=1 Tax=Butyricicoccus intestinisimiae TaxID=2841509 RepID=A0ABS6ESG9_9FIRM|nr:RidA family protein [Butyricicoccus intestinisimiae]MBU5490634.1 RidA family protein [Butyricicoccus intestinisimiae]
MKKVISTSNAPAAIGPYSQAIETDGYVFTSGQIPINPTTGEVEGKTIEEQTEQVMKNIGALLEASGLTFANVVKTTCFLADLNDFAAFNAVYAKYFPNEAPARSCFAVAGLPKGAKLEVETICAK